MKVRGKLILDSRSVTKFLVLDSAGLVGSLADRKIDTVLFRGPLEYPRSDLKGHPSCIIVELRGEDGCYIKLLT